jgi:DHA2 family multidrug resistance protein
VGRPIDAATEALLKPIVERAALAQSIDEAWAAIAILTISAVLFLPFRARCLAVRKADFAPAASQSLPGSQSDPG